MPRIPTYEQQATPQAGLSVRGLDTGAGDVVNLAGQTASVFGRNAAILQRAKEQDAAAEAAVLVSRAKVDWLQRSQQAKLSAAEGAPDFAKTLLEDYTEDANQRAASAKTRTAQVFVQTRLAEFGAELGIDAVEFETGARAAVRKSRLGEGIDAAATAAELNPNGWARVLAEQIAVQDTIDMPPAERTAWRQNAQDAIQARAAVGAARMDPAGTLRRIVAPEPADALFRTLSPKARDAVLQEAEAQQRAAWSREDHAYTAAKRAEEDMNDAAAKDGDRLLASGQLTTTWIEKNRGRLSPGDYRYLYRALSGGEGGSRSVEAYADLRMRASNGEDVRGDARAALQRGAIKVDDFDRLVGEVEQSRPNWYKRGVSYLTGMSGYSDLNPDPGAAQTKANMLDDWAQWSDSHPQATDGEAHDAYNRIAKEYSLIDRSKLTVGMRAPRYLVGSRNQPDLDASEKATVEAYQRGEIDEAEARRQAALIAQWRSAMTRGVTDAHR